MGWDIQLISEPHTVAKMKKGSTPDVQLLVCWFIKHMAPWISPESSQ